MLSKDAEAGIFRNSQPENVKPEVGIFASLISILEEGRSNCLQSYVLLNLIDICMKAVSPPLLIWRLTCTMEGGMTA